MKNFDLSRYIELRREIHKNPELGYNEFQTAKLVMNELDRLGVPYVRGARTGVIAEISKGIGKCIALRADMDALPILEDNDLPYKSVNDGIMHACGHDLHTSMLLGACALLRDSEFEGTVKFIFQPAEEGNFSDPENKSGGERIVEEGVLNNVDYALALHAHSLLDVGTQMFIPGQALASSTAFTITVVGKAGHAGAAHHLCTDAILIASELVQALHHIVSRNIAATKPGVISITQINGGNSTNIIADKVILRGTIRSLDSESYSRMMQRIETLIVGTAMSYETDINFTIDKYSPILLNDINLNNKLKPLANQIFQPSGQIEAEPSLGGEDFAFYSRKVPSVFYFIGAKNTSDNVFFLHHPKVIFNEGCMEPGIEFLSKSALSLLNSE